MTDSFITKAPQFANRRRQGFGGSRGYGVASESKKTPQLNSSTKFNAASERGKREEAFQRTPVKFASLWDFTGQAEDSKSCLGTEKE